MAILLRMVLGIEVGTADTTGVPSTGTGGGGGGICPPVGKLMAPLLDNMPLDVVLAGVTDCAASPSFTARMSSRGTSATVVLTDSAIMACTVRKGRLSLFVRLFLAFRPACGAGDF